MVEQIINYELAKGTRNKDQVTSIINNIDTVKPIFPGDKNELFPCKNRLYEFCSVGYRTTEICCIFYQQTNFSYLLHDQLRTKRVIVLL